MHNGAQISEKILHASAVAIGDKAVLIKGPSGSGKSTLALKLIGLGATLIADDKTLLQRSNDKLLASCPKSIAGQIEARGIGIISVPFVNDVPLSLIVDLSNSVNERMPEYDTESQFGISVRRIGRAPLDAFAQAIYLMCVGGKEV